jgi:hypothetical protein
MGTFEMLLLGALWVGIVLGLVMAAVFFREEDS